MEELIKERSISNVDVQKNATAVAQFENLIERTSKLVTCEDDLNSSFVFILAYNCKINGITEAEAKQLILERFNYETCEIESIIVKVYQHQAKIGTFAQFAQFAQYELDEDEDNNEDFNSKLLHTPTIPAEVYEKLPELLRKGCNQFTHPREKDVFLTGAITILSGCMTSVFGFYSQRKVYPNLFSFTIAPAASGKGALLFAKALAMTHHKNMVEKSRENKKQYEIELEGYNKTKKGKKSHGIYQAPQKPNFKVLFIPANSSTSAVIGHLAQNDGIGIICETEADTMGNSFKQEWGGYSDLLRKSFHHEPVTHSRKTNDEFVEVEKPRISVALTGTPSQVQGLITSAEDGLFSRFVFYTFKVKPQWRDVTPTGGLNLTDYFNELSQEVDKMAKYLGENSTEFVLTPDQWFILNSQFDLWLDKISRFISEDASSTVTRLGLIVFRIAMVLSSIRKYEDATAEEKITCEEDDFEAALALAEVYLKHAILMFSSLPKGRTNQSDPNKKRFFDALPSDLEFTRKEAVEIGASVGIKERTVDKYLKSLLGRFLEQPVKQGPYRKIK